MANVSQSDILGFDTRKFSGTPNTGIFSKIKNIGSSVFQGALSLFDKGVNVFTSVQDRLDAIKKIDAETVTTAQETTVIPAPIITDNQKTLLLGVATIIIGSIVVDKVLK